MNEIESIYIFYKVALNSSVSAAASDMGVSKSVVSRKLSDFEKSLGVLLFIRTTRHTRLTEEGNELFEKIKDSFRNVEDSVVWANEIKGKVKGVLRVTAPIEFSHFLSSTMLTDFHNEYPDIKVELEGSSEKKDLSRDGFDLAIRIGKVSDSAYRYKAIGQAHLRLFGAPKYADSITEISDLETAPWITSENKSQNEKGNVAQLLINKQKTELSYDNIAYVASGLTIKKNIIANGHGIGFLPAFIFKESIERGEIVNILPQVTMQPIDMGILFPNGRTTPARLRVFIDFISERFKDVDLS